MRNFLPLVFAIVLLTLSSTNVRGQEYQFQDNLMSVVFNVDSLTANEIHSKALSAIANSFKSANNVIQLNDKEANKIVLKGSSVITVRNPYDALFPKALQNTGVDLSYGFTMNLDSRDSRYRIVISLNEFKSPMTSSAESKYLSYELKVTNEEIDRIIDEYLNGPGMGLFGKKKKEAVRESYKFYPEAIKQALMEDAKFIAKLINDAISNDSKLTKNSLLNEDF